MRAHLSLRCRQILGQRRNSGGPEVPQGQTSMWHISFCKFSRFRESCATISSQLGTPAFVVAGVVDRNPERKSALQPLHGERLGQNARHRGQQGRRNSKPLVSVFATCFASSIRSLVSFSFRSPWLVLLAGTFCSDVTR